MKIFKIKQFFKYLAIFTVINLTVFIATADKQIPFKYKADFLSIDYIIGNLIVSVLMAVIPAVILQMPSLQSNKKHIILIRTFLILFVYLIYFFGIV